MNFTFFLIYCIIITISPGPTNIVILSTVHNYGVKKAVEFCYGATIAFCMLLTLSVLLNSILTLYLPNILIFMQIIGTAYILYLAYKIYKIDNLSNTEKEVGTFKTGFLMQFINPKVILFCITVFPSFIMPYYSSFYELMIFVFVITIIGTIAFFSWVLFGSLLKAFLQKYQKVVNIILSLFLVFCAIIISGIIEL